MCDKKQQLYLSPEEIVERQDNIFNSYDELGSFLKVSYEIGLEPLLALQRYYGGEWKVILADNGYDDLLLQIKQAHIVWALGYGRYVITTRSRSKTTFKLFWWDGPFDHFDDRLISDSIKDIESLGFKIVGYFAGSTKEFSV